MEITSFIFIGIDKLGGLDNPFKAIIYGCVLQDRTG